MVTMIIDNDDKVGNTNNTQHNIIDYIVDLIHASL